MYIYIYIYIYISLVTMTVWETARISRKASTASASAGFRRPASYNV